LITLDTYLLLEDLVEGDGGLEVDGVVVPVAEVVQELGQDLLPESLRVILVQLRHVYQTLQGDK
jgi:hypothetical protein